MSNWSPNVILVDADYLDEVVFDMTVHFEPIIGRHLPPADLCHWLDCVALDGGLRQGKEEIQAVFLHSQELEAFRQFAPAHFENELNGKAFNDYVGEFVMQSFPVERVVSQDDFFIESLEAALLATDVKRIMVVGDMEAYGDRVAKTVSEAAERKKDVTVYSMRPLEAKGFQPEILGYSLLAALGIRSEELMKE